MIPGLSSKSLKAWDKEEEETPKLSQTAAGWRRAVTADLGGPGLRGHPRGGGHPVSRRNKRAERSLRDRASSTRAPRWGAGDGYRGATALARAKEEMESRVRVVHKGSSAASKPATRGACSGCHPHSRRPTAPREHLPGHRGFPGRRRPGKPRCPGRCSRGAVGRRECGWHPLQAPRVAGLDAAEDPLCTTRTRDSISSFARARAVAPR